MLSLPTGDFTRPVLCWDWIALKTFKRIANGGCLLLVNWGSESVHVYSNCFPCSLQRYLCSTRTRGSQVSLLHAYSRFTGIFAPRILAVHRYLCFFFYFSASQIFEESYVKEGSSYYHSYANKVFGGWDMCIEDETAAKLQFMRIVKDIEVRLIEP